MIKDKGKFFLVSGIVFSALVLFIIIIPFCVRLIIGFSKPYSLDVEGDKMSHKVMEAFQKRDTEQLKWLFCKKSIATENLDEQIEGAFRFIEGNISSEINRRDIMTGGEKAVNEGECIRMYIGTDINNIYTDVEKKYSIHFSAYAINQKYEEKVGISELTIYDEESDDKYTIGEFIL